MTKLVLLGTISSAHGVRGEVKIRTFLEDIKLLEKAPLLDKNGGELFSLRVTGVLKDSVIAKIDGTHDKNAADKLKNTELFAPSSILPEKEDDEFYYGELIGLAVQSRDGKKLGIVKEILNFGAGDILQIISESGEEDLLPFSENWVENIDISAGIITIKPVEYSD